MNRLELWNPTQWGDVLAAVEEDPEAIVAQLQDLGI
jgi:DNA-binding transcriptional regulator/RsmH inhibitor MraZ